MSPCRAKDVPLTAEELLDVGSQFWPQVQIGRGCWLWTGTILSDGYGGLTIKSRPQRANRIAFRLTVGDISAEICICHSCDNPPCVRPDHLFAGTHTDNMRDKIAKARGVSPLAQANARKTRCPAGHEYTSENTILRGRYRECRTCKYDRIYRRIARIRSERGAAYRGGRYRGVV